MDMSKKYQDKNWLQQKYIDEKKSTYKIADILNCDHETIRRWLKTLNIPRRTPSEARIGKFKGELNPNYRPLEKRLWNNVNIKDNIIDCWFSTACCDTSGYPNIEIKGSSKGAHIISWEWYNGRKVKDGYIIHHICKHRKCCNPTHLQEMMKTEHDSGENNGMSKLTEKIVLEIRADWATGKYTQQQLAEKHNTSQQQISKIVNRKIWKHI